MNLQESDSQGLMVQRLNQETRTNKGLWTKEQHDLFLIGIDRFSQKSWKQIAQLVQTRNQTQVRSHAQKYFNRQVYQMSKIQNQVLPERLMNTSQKTRSRLNLDELDNQMEIQENNPSLVQLQGSINKSLKEIKTKKITKSYKSDKETKINLTTEQDKYKDKLTKDTIIICESNNTLVNKKIFQSDSENNHKISPINSLYDNKRTPIKRKSTQNKKNKTQNAIDSLKKNQRPVLNGDNINFSEKLQQLKTKDTIILSMSPCQDYFPHSDLEEASPSNAQSLNTIQEYFRISNYSAFKLVISSLQIE